MRRVLAVGALSAFALFLAAPALATPGGGGGPLIAELNKAQDWIGDMAGPIAFIGCALGFYMLAIKRDQRGWGAVVLGLGAAVAVSQIDKFLSFFNASTTPLALLSLF